jgi:hypothetical protein
MTPLNLHGADDLVKYRADGVAQRRVGVITTVDADVDLTRVAGRTVPVPPVRAGRRTAAGSTDRPREPTRERTVAAATPVRSRESLRPAP